MHPDSIRKPVPRGSQRSEFGIPFKKKRICCNSNLTLLKLLKCYRVLVAITEIENVAGSLFQLNSFLLMTANNDDRCSD